MRTETALNHFQRFERGIRSIYRQARSFQMPHSWILEKKKERIYSDRAWEKCPGWVRNRINQISGELLNLTHERDVTWLHTTPGNPTPRTFEEVLESEEWKQCPDSEKSNLTSGAHYWLVPALPHGKALRKEGAEWVARFTIGKPFN